MTVLSSTCSYVNQTLKQGEISRNPKLRDNPLCSQQEIRLEAMLSFSKACWTQQEIFTSFCGVWIRPRQLLSQAMVNVLCKISLVPGTLLTLMLTGTFRAQISLTGVGSPGCSVLQGHRYPGFYPAFPSSFQQSSRTDKSKIASLLWGCVIHSTHSSWPQ